MKSCAVGRVGGRRKCSGNVSYTAEANLQDDPVITIVSWSHVLCCKQKMLELACRFAGALICKEITNPVQAKIVELDADPSIAIDFSGAAAWATSQRLNR